MKKILSYIVLITIALVANSCSENGTLPDQKGSINIEFKCSELLTRADDDSETAIESIDYFIYTNLYSAAVYHNRITSSSTTATLDDVEDLREMGKTCYVYAVANLPSNVSISGTETIATLQAITVTTDFTAAQTSFVMDSKEAVQTTVGGSVTVPLHRLAAKLTMTVNIPESIESGSVTYIPDYGNLRIYYVNAVKTGSFDGTYMTYGDEDSEDANKDFYFNYPYTWPVSVAEGDDNYVGTTVTPFYTYPQAWETEEVHEPYFKVILPWAVSGDTGSSKPYYYKVVIPNSFNEKIDRNTFYKFILDIGVLGSEVDDGTVEISGDYYVVDWSAAFTVGGADGSDALTKGKYLSVAQNEFSIYAEPSITIPVISSHNLSISSVSCTYTDYSSDNPTTKTLTSGFEVTPNDRSSITLTHNLVSDITDSDLDCSIYEFTITIANEAGCAPVTVRVTQYPSLYVTSEASNKYVFINNNSNHANSGWDNNTRYKIIYDDGAYGEHTTLSHTFEFSEGDGNQYSEDGVSVTLTNVSDNSGILGYRGKRFGTASNRPGIMTITAPEGEVITGLTITYYSSIIRTYNSQTPVYNPTASGSTKTSWSGSTPTLTVTIPHSNSENSSNIVTTIRVSYTGYPSTDQQKLGALRHYNYSVSGNNNFNIYTINVSNLSGNTSGWYIADPRVTVPVNIDRLRGGGSNQLEGYLPANSEASNAIAPQFKIASSAGASLYSDQNQSRMNYEQAMRRCASYQEDGYPAGRWRIPTDAEIRFVISLSNNNKIPSLFGGTYWAASGAKLDDQGNETVTSNGASVRCVYDSWYWGDQPLSQYMTTWSGFQTN